MRWLVVITLALAACNADLDEPWQLQHDRIIAVRATPPRIVAGERSTIDLLVGFDGQPIATRGPDFVAVVSPMSLSNLVTPEAGQWIVTAPTEERLEAARAELGLPAGAPVPLQIGVAAAWPTPVMSLDNMTFGATKVVWLGERGDNPPITGLLINGVEPADMLVVPKQTKVPLYVEADDTVHIVNWLTSCGTMHDFDLHSAYLTVEPEDPHEGELAMVLRDDRGGVSWRTWPIVAE